MASTHVTDVGQISNLFLRNRLSLCLKMPAFFSSMPLKNPTEYTVQQASSCLPILGLAMLSLFYTG